MSDNNADNLDSASEIEALFRQASIAAICRQPKVPADFDGKTCVECADEIVEARLLLNKFTCIICQTLIERTNALMRRR